MQMMQHFLLKDSQFIAGKSEIFNNFSLFSGSKQNAK